MRRLRLIALAVLIVVPASSRAGLIGSVLAKYASAGAGIGAIIGAAAATVPYLQSKQPYDYYTGAGAGMLAGCGAGLILGVIDVSTRDWDEEAPQALGPAQVPMLWAWTAPQGGGLGFRMQF